MPHSSPALLNTQTSVLLFVSVEIHLFILRRKKKSISENVELFLNQTAVTDSVFTPLVFTQIEPLSYMGASTRMHGSCGTNGHSKLIPEALKCTVNLIYFWYNLATLTIILD